MRLNHAVIMLLAAALGASNDSASAEPNVDMHLEGTTICGGNAFARGDREIHFTAYILGNYYNNQTIDIKSISVFDAMGKTAAKYETGQLPMAFNKTLGGKESVLKPHQTAIFRTHDLLRGKELSDSERPIQVMFVWETKHGTQPLIAGIERIVRDAKKNDSTGQWEEGLERSRSHADCVTFFENEKQK